MAEVLEINIIKDKENPLLKRREVTAYIEHPGQATPTRETARNKLAAMLNTDSDQTALISLFTEYGRQRTKAKVHIYEDSHSLLSIEPKYILKRNKLVEEEKD
ncbi:MAG: 30S ribosomal protein S24e [Candidatus Hodarchaeota archaeon]